MAGVIPSYDEIKIRIVPDGPRRYRVLASGPDGGASWGEFTPPVSELELDNFILRVGLPRRTVRGFSSSQMEEAKEFGAKLFDSLFQGDIAEAYDSARSRAEDHERGLRLTLQLSSAPELMDVPWEFLYESPAFLSQSIYTPVVRSLDLKHSRRPPKVTLPLRILAMVSNPSGSAELDVGAERHKLDMALEGLRRKGFVELIWLDRATMAELDRLIGAPDEIHVLHYIGHGAYDDRAQAGTLMLEEDDGRPRNVTGEELSSLLIDERSLRLAVLNSCEGARTSHLDPFSGVATSLVSCGIEAVVGMQFEITDKAAIAFSERLYTCLSQGFAVDAALAQSRRAIFSSGSDIEFATPVLFLRSADTRLFDVDVTSATAAAVTAEAPVVEPEPPASPESPEPPEPEPVSPTRALPPARISVLFARIRRQSRGRLAAAAAAALALVLGAAVALGGSGEPPPDTRAQLRAFVGETGRILERSRPAYFEINRIFAPIKDADEQTGSGIDYDDADQALREIISNRRDRAAEARSLDAPTPQSRKARRALAAAFDRSAENDVDIQQCVQGDRNDEAIMRGGRCLDQIRRSGQAAGDAKQEFLAIYNQIRKRLGMAEQSPSF